MRDWTDKYQHYNPECIGRQWFDGLDDTLEVRAWITERGDRFSGESRWFWAYDTDGAEVESGPDARKAVEHAHALALGAADEQAEQEAHDAGPDALTLYRNEREREEM